MSTIASVPALSSRRNAELNRIWSVTKLHFTNKWNTIAVPWMILGIIFLANFAIWWIIYSSLGANDRKDFSDGLEYSGSSSFIFVYMMVVAIQAINLTFPFALGFSATRRDFYLGSSLAFVLFSLIYAAGLTLLSFVEEWTHGWGVGGRMFTAVYFGAGPVWQRFFVFFATFLFFFFVGAVFATVYVRWKSTGLLVVGGILVLALVAGLALIGWTQSWEAVGKWFADSGAVGVVAWLLVPTALAAVAGFFILRRATPKN